MFPSVSHTRWWNTKCTCYQEIAQKVPRTRCIRKALYAFIFLGLSDEDALWLASKHNNSGSFRHAMTFQDEVSQYTAHILG